MFNLLRTVILFTAVAVTVPAQAGRYPVSGTQTFTMPDGAPTFTDGSSVGTSPAISLDIFTNRLRMQVSPFSNPTAWKLPVLDGTTAIQAFDATFTVAMVKDSASTIPSGGWALSFGPIPSATSSLGSGDLGFAMNGGIVISFDTFANTTNDVPSIEVYCNNTSVGNFLSTAFVPTNTVSGGTFTLTNPVTGGTTAAIAYNATTSQVRSAMAAVSGWGTVTVTGSAGAWTVNHGVVGSYADPTGNGAALLGPTSGTFMTPGLGGVVVTNTQDGSPTANEIWTIGRVSRGFRYDTTQRAVSVHWDYDGLDVTYNGQVIFNNLPTPGFSPAGGHQFAFTSTGLGTSTAPAPGGTPHDMYLDDVVIATTPAGPANTGVIISEFMAENKSILEDEDMDSPDWIEIYNGTAAAVNLGGNKLTNGTLTWTFPSVTVAAYGHLVVYASGKNRTTNTALLHTNFTLPKTGGTLSLLSAADATLSTYTYPNQTEDISYGTKYQGGAVGFLDTPSPGAPTLYTYIVAPNGPAEDTIWSREGGIITGATPISITAPLVPGSVVRYTTDNTLPSSASALYTTAFSVATPTNLRARVFTPNYLPGPVSSRTFLQIDASLSDYNTSGQPFKSHLPVIVMDSFGIGVDGVTDSSQARPHRYTYSVVIDKDLTGFASITSPTVDFQGRSGTHVRGDSSSGFAQKSYAWETWDNLNDDKKVAILGMPAESDWALYGPYTDKTFFRNFIIYQKMRDLHGGRDGFGMRVKLVELFYNQDVGQAVSYNDYRGVYVLMERIKVGKDRVDIEKLNNLVSDPALITGGYIFRRDRTSADGNTPLPDGMHSHTPNSLNAAQTTYLTNYINSFHNALYGANFADPVLGYAPYIDRDSFIDNWWFVEIAKQIDGYRLSTYFTKDRNGKIVAAPIWDYNLALGNADYLAGDQPTGWYWNQTDTYWWAQLRLDPNYEARNWDRYWELRRGVFEQTSILAYIDQLASVALNGSTTPVTNNMSLSAGQPSTLENATMRHYRKYPILGTYVWPNGAGYAQRLYYNSNGNATTGEIDWMKNWLVQRFAWLDNQNTSGTVIYRPPLFSNYGGNVSSGTSVTITPFTGTAPSGFTYASGTLYYTTDGSDPKAGATPPTEFTLISGSGAACKWLVPSASNGGTTLTAGAGADQWTNYTDPTNIANWTSATTGIGYDLNPDYLSHFGAGGNTQSQMYNINATCYLRVTFNIPDQATLNNIATLKLGMKYDDGFRAYVNGAIVAGRADTDPSVTSDPAHALCPVARDEAAAVQFEDIDITATGLSALRVGTNVLAIHCLNGVNNTSSDLLIFPKLTYYPPGGGGGGGGIAYTGPVNLTSSSTVKSRLLANGVWSPITTAEFVVNAAPASASNIVISEIHYNPLPAAGAEITAGYGDNDFEYVELTNVGAGNVDLTGCNFTVGINFDFDIADPGTLTLAPGQRILVVANLAAATMRYGAMPGVKVVGPFGGSLSNNGETVTLVDINNAAIASVTYGTTEPWPVGANTLGYSLVLNNPVSGATYGATAWRTSAQPGGTPGAPAGAAFSGSPAGDTDGDGYSDYLEWALGNPQNSPGTTNRPGASLQTFTVATVTSPYLTFSYRRNDAADGVNYTVQLSNNLTSWASDASAVVYVATVANGDGTSTVIYRAAQPFNAATPQYMRLRVAP